MNQQCKVCGEPAAGFHFGAFTCEGCKSFFGRTYNNLSSISECKNGGVCVINKKNRTACKACRLRKCLMVGMSKSGSRYGRRSNWFKIHCLLQEQSGNNNNGPVPGGPLASHFGAGFLPNFLPPSLQAHQSLVGYGQAMTGKDERNSPSHEDLALQSHLLQVAMIKQHKAQQQLRKSPRPERPPGLGALASQSPLKMLNWASSKSTSGDEDQSQSQSQQAQQPQPNLPGQAQAASPEPSPEATPTSMNLHSNAAFQYKELVNSAHLFTNNVASAASMDGVFRPYLQLYNRAAVTPSDSGASSVDTEEQDESRSNSALSFMKGASSSPPNPQPPQSFPRRKVNATVTFATDYLAHHGHHGQHNPNHIYPPAELVTPATAQQALRGGDLLLASPSPGGLAIEQLEPIDLSLKAVPGERPESSLAQGPSDKSDSDSESNGGGSKSGSPEPAQTKSNPLDLSVDVKRPTAEVSL